MITKAGEILAQGVPVALLAVLIAQGIRQAVPEEWFTKFVVLLVIGLSVFIKGIDHYAPSLAEWLIPALWAGSGGPVLYSGLRTFLNNKGSNQSQTPGN
jgi:hypothetical protein